jgi:hypothetical protein
MRRGIGIMKNFMSMMWMRMRFLEVGSKEWAGLALLGMGFLRGADFSRLKPGLSGGFCGCFGHGAGFVFGRFFRPWRDLG